MNLVSSVKNKLRWGRNTVRDLLHRPAERAGRHQGASFVNLPVDEHQSSFFGYYTRSPWNRSGDILFQETRGRGARASVNHPLVVKVFRPITSEVISLGETYAWNWQQGCMLQWLGPKGDRVIYNAYDPHDDAYRSVIVELTSGRAMTICQPIYSVNPQGTHALTLNFSRLAKLRPDYGYFNKKSPEKLGLSEDGIWTVDLVRNESRLILSLKEIIESGEKEPQMDADKRGLGAFRKYEDPGHMAGLEHKVNHIDISPDGKRFLFLHRWFTDRGKMTRLLTADVEGNNLCCLANDEMVSHCIWKPARVRAQASEAGPGTVRACAGRPPERPGNERQILAYARKKAIGDRYFLFTDQSSEYQIIGEGLLNEDGHPSFSPEGRWLLTDTYPGKDRMSSLILFDLRDKRRIELGAFFQPYRFSGELRCDLHPRWSLDRRFVSFDSCHTGRRSFYVLDVRESVGSSSA